MEESDATEQIIFSSMDMHLYPLWDLVLYLEIRGHNMEHSDFYMAGQTVGTNYLESR